MPPHFQREGIDAVKEIRKLHPGTGVVILSQYDDPDYAVSLLSEGSAGYAYLLKDRIAEGDQLARAIREVATGGSMLDPVIVSALMQPGAPHRRPRPPTTTSCSAMVADGRTIKAIAATTKTTPAAVEAQVERLFVQLADGGVERARRARSTGCAGCTRRSSSARSRARRSAACCRRASPTSCSPRAAASARPRRLEVTVLMSDIRGYTIDRRARRSGRARRSSSTVTEPR